MRLVLSFLFLAFSSSLVAQFGVRAKYNIHNFDGYSEFINSKTNQSDFEAFPTGLEIGVDYWFRLKNRRIEFMPEIFASLPNAQTVESTAEIEQFYVGFAFNTAIYIFDLEGDCDCPTFSKQGPSIKKGFFINLAPTFVAHNKTVDTDLLGPTTDWTPVFRFGAGFGYDIGINDLITITPYFNYFLTAGESWQSINIIDPLSSIVEPVETGWNNMQFGLRFGFRPDYGRKYGR